VELAAKVSYLKLVHRRPKAQFCADDDDRRHYVISKEMYVIGVESMRIELAVLPINSASVSIRTWSDAFHAFAMQGCIFKTNLWGQISSLVLRLHLLLVLRPLLSGAKDNWDRSIDRWMENL
jgi:hypothetical protein